MRKRRLADRRLSDPYSAPNKRFQLDWPGGLSRPRYFRYKQAHLTARLLRKCPPEVLCIKELSLGFLVIRQSPTLFCLQGSRAVHPLSISRFFLLFLSFQDTSR